MYLQVPPKIYILRRTLCKGLMTQRQHLESSTPNKRVVDERPKWRFPNWRFDHGEHRSPASASLPLPHVGRSAKERLEALGYVLSLLPTGTCSCPLHLPPFLPSLGLAPPRRCRQARSHRSHTKPARSARHPPHLLPEYIHHSCCCLCRFLTLLLLISSIFATRKLPEP